MLERRRTKRQLWNQNIKMSLMKTELGQEEVVHFHAIGSNIGGHGVGFTTLHPVEPGHVVRFGDEIEGHQVGLIIHSRKEEGEYAAGMAFK